MLNFQEHVLKRQLDRLPPQARVAFAASCAQRLASVYRTFVGKVAPVDGANLFDQGPSYVWAHILATPEEATTAQLLANVMAVIPDDDAPDWTPLTPYAEDALAALAYCLRCLQSADVQVAACAARRVYEALDYFVISRDDVSPSDLGAETRVLSDPAIQAELERQARDFADLSSQGNSLSRELIDNLRRRSMAEQAITIAD